MRIEKPWVNFYDKGVSKTINYPNITMWEYIFNNANKHLDSIAYSYYGTNVSYKKFMEEVESTAKSFKNLGVKENEKVSIISSNIPEAIISFYAINMIGAVSVMIHPLSAVNEILNYLEISDSKYVVCLDLAYSKLKTIISKTKVKKTIIISASNKMNLILKTIYNITSHNEKIKCDSSVLNWNEFIKLDYNKEYKVKRNAKDEAVILFSGGTTGTPKGIRLTNLNFNAATMQTANMMEPVKAGESILTIMPIFHSFGLDVCIHTPLSLGLKCILIPIFNYKKFGLLIRQYKPNYIVGVPVLLENIVTSRELKTKDLSFIKGVVTGGDTLSIELKDKFDEFLKTHNSNATARVGYGLTEGCGASCLLPKNIQKKGSVGVPTQDMLYKIVDPVSLLPLPYNKVGEICISGPNVMLGYINNKEDNVFFKDKEGITWLRTGDLGKMDEDGFVYFVERLKRVIVTNGYNIYPKYIEEVLNKHPYISSSLVVGCPHPYKNQIAKAYIVLKDNINEDKALKNIKEHCELYLSKYSIPYVFEFKKNLPINDIGKIDFKKL